jgi:hypothetical protein
MTTNKDLKRLVRARMRKTGEAYTTARAQLLKKSQSAAPIGVAPAKTETKGPKPSEYAKLAGMSDAVMKEKTGCSWKNWVHALDHYGAQEMSHREIAELVRTKYDVGSWWTQTVAVGYERIRGLRVRGQARDGSYAMTKSRTFPVSVATLFDAWANAGKRRRWLTGAGVRVRTATPSKSMRLDWPEGGIVAVGFVSKGAAKSSVAIEHSKLPDRETANRLKQFWSERFEALAQVLR